MRHIEKGKTEQVVFIRHQELPTVNKDYRKLNVHARMAPYGTSFPSTPIKILLLCLSITDSPLTFLNKIKNYLLLHNHSKFLYIYDNNNNCREEIRDIKNNITSLNK